MLKKQAEQLIRKIEQAPEASLIKFMQIWQFTKQSGLPSSQVLWLLV